MVITPKTYFSVLKSTLKNYFAILEKKRQAKFQLAKKSKLLDKKFKQAYAILECCELCERKCKVNRLKEKGWCHLQDKMLLGSCFDHYGEESFFVLSFTIFSGPAHSDVFFVKTGA